MKSERVAVPPARMGTKGVWGRGLGFKRLYVSFSFRQALSPKP